MNCKRSNLERLAQPVPLIHLISLGFNLIEQVNPFLHHEVYTDHEFERENPLDPDIQVEESTPFEVSVYL